MKVDVTLKNIRRTKVLGEVIEKDVEKLTRHIQGYKNDGTVHFDIKLEKSPHKKEYISWATMHIPKKTFSVHNTSEDKLTCINEMTQALIRQVEKFKQGHERQRNRDRKGVGEVYAETQAHSNVENCELEDL